MSQWQYLTFVIPYDKRHKNWVVQYDDGPPLVGLQAVLDAYSRQGWELVYMQPEHYGVSPGFGKWYMEPEIYRAIFRRPVEA